MRRKRVSHATSRASSSKCSSAAGSRSMQTSVPDEPIRSAIRRAWPPAPKVQSITVSPVAGAVSSISSPARTGTCTRFMSRRMAKALRHLPDLRVQRLLLLLPALLRPHLEVVAHADHHDLLLDARVREQRRRERHAAARVQLDVEGVPLVEAREPAVVRTDRVQRAERAIDDGLVRLGGPDRHAGLGVLGENGATGERRAEPGRNAEPVLRVQRVLEVATKRQRSYPRERVQTGVAEWEEPRHSGRLLLPRFPTISHSAIRFPTFPSDGRAAQGTARDFWLYRAANCQVSGGTGTRASRVLRADAAFECNFACRTPGWW